MRNKIALTLLIVLVLAGAGMFIRARGTAVPAPEPTVEDPYLSQPSSENQCAYVWAYKDLPDVNADFQKAVRTILPEAETHATAFGEDCASADGSAVFSAMETDFYVLSAAADLYDNETLGSIVERILAETDNFAPPRVPGGQLGFVEFTFWNGTEQRILRVSIAEGKELRERGLRGADLLAAIETP